MSKIWLIGGAAALSVLLLASVAIGLTQSEDTFQAGTLEETVQRYLKAAERDWDRMVTFYDFPKEHWGHLRTTNPVESPFAALRLRTDAAKRYKRVDRAIAVIWKMLMVAEQRFRRLKAPELIEDVYLGAQYADGIAIESTAEKVAA